MALAKYKNLIEQDYSHFYDQTFSPGAVCPSSGIYRCRGCGATVVAERDRRLPPQNHHQHSVLQGQIIWQCLIQSTMTNPTA
jgi:hypothetical protein